MLTNLYFDIKMLTEWSYYRLSLRSVIGLGFCRKPELSLHFAQNLWWLGQGTSGGLGKEVGGKNDEAFQRAVFSELAAAEPSKDVTANLDTGVGLQNGMDEDNDSSSASVPKRAAMADLFRAEKLNEYEDLRPVNTIRGSLTKKWNMKLEPRSTKPPGLGFCR